MIIENCENYSFVALDLSLMLLRRNGLCSSCYVLWISVIL